MAEVKAEAPTPKVVLVGLPFVHDHNITVRPIAVDNVHHSQCLGPVFMHLCIAGIHLIVFTVSAEVQHVCQSRGVLTMTCTMASTTTRGSGSANFKIFNTYLFSGPFANNDEILNTF